MLQNKLIYEFEKNSAEKVRAEIGNYKGKDVFSLRVYFNAREKEDDWRPTKKGICLQITQIPELLSAIQKAFEECIQMGIEFEIKNDIGCGGSNAN